MPTEARVADGSQRLKAWIDGGRTVELGGRRMFVRSEAAQGRPPLLLIHGYPTASYDWALVWPGLSRHFSLYTLDLLGFGLSDKPRDSDYPISLQADLCVEFLSSLGVEAPHVLAHDYGDTVAQELLAREREGRLRLSSMVLLNGGLFPETHRPRTVQKLLALPVIGPLLAGTMAYPKFEATMLSIAGRVPPSSQDLADLWTLIEANGGRPVLARLISYMDQRRRNRERWVGALVHSAVPRRLICGAVDPISGRHLADRYRELVPDADVVVLEGVGHYPQLETPEAVCEAFLAFHAQLAA